jgi:hypothetical protein
MAKINGNDEERTVTVRVPISIRRRGGRKLVVAPDGTNIIAATICRHIDSAMVKAEAHFGAQRLNRLVIKLNITALGVGNGRESDGALTQPHLNAGVAPTRENRLPCLVLVGTKARQHVVAPLGNPFRGPAINA